MDLVNKTEEDLKKEYPYWQIEKYSSNEIILYKESLIVIVDNIFL